MRLPLVTLLSLVTFRSVTLGFVPPTTPKYATLKLSSVNSKSVTRPFVGTCLNVATDNEDSNLDMETINRDADAIFNIIDADGNGFISSKELIDHLSDAGYTEVVTKKIFSKMDKNNDGEISKEEFQKGLILLAALRSAPGLGNFNSEFEKEIYEDADQLFNSADSDNDGEIDATELKNYLGVKFTKFSKARIDNIFEILDVNNDGKISKEEVRDAFVRYSALRLAIGEGPNFK